MTATVTVLGSGRTTPALPVALLTDSAPGRQVTFSRSESDALLGNRDWLQRAYDRGGDNTIASHLGVSKDTVRRRRAVHGIASRPRGRQHGARGTTTTARELPRSYKPAVMRIAARWGEENRTDGPAPSPQLLATRTQALQGAYLAGDAAAIDDALIALGSACGLVLEQRQKVRLAA